MGRRTFEEIPFYSKYDSYWNHDFRDLLKDLRQKISKYKGKYDSKEFKEFLLALLYLDIDILRDKTYSEEQLEQLKKIRIFRRLLDYNIYGSLRKFLTSTDNSLIFSEVYDEDSMVYQVYNESFLSLEMDFWGDKCIITLPSEVLQASKLRYEKMDKLLDVLEEKRKERKSTLEKKAKIDLPIRFTARSREKMEEDYFYNIEIGTIIEQLIELKLRHSCLPNTKQNEYNNELYEKLAETYGPFQQNFTFDHKNEEINLDSEGTITGTSTVKETPVAIFQKKTIYY